METVVAGWQGKGWGVEDERVFFDGKSAITCNTIDRLNIYVPCLMIWQAAVACFSGSEWEAYTHFLHRIRTEFLVESGKCIRANLGYFV
jgi:hypothetical protein